MGQEMSKSESHPSAALPIIDALHRAVDQATQPLQTEHAHRLSCREGCADCCTDGLTVFEVEAQVIRHHYPELLREGRAHPEGRCAFLNPKGACRVYAHRPYVCRTQGLPLRWLDFDEEDELVEYRDICELNDEATPLEELEPESCWTLGAVEEKLRTAQTTESPGDLRRVSLRALFDR